MQIGAQFFTVRAFTKTLDDLSLTLRKVADIGYKTIQLSATCPFEPEWMKQQLDANGLKCVLTHTAPQKLQEQPEKVCADHKVFGCGCVGLGMFSLMNGDPQERYAEFVSTYKPVARQLKENGWNGQHFPEYRPASPNFPEIIPGIQLYLRNFR